MTTLEDRTLLRMLRHGERDAPAALCDQYEELLFTIAANLLNDKALAEDVVQDVLIAFVQSVGSFRLRGTLQGFLVTCVANRARDYLRSQRRRPTVSLDAAVGVTADSDPPVRAAIEGEQIRLAGRALAQLPSEQREAIVLRLHADMKFKEIAKLQNVSTKTVLSRYRYGIDKLRSMLNGEVPT